MRKSDEIKRQAIRLMADKGFEALSLRQLAAAVGMRSGSIYTHYPSKAHLLLDICTDYLGALLSGWQGQRKCRQQNAQQQLLAFVAGHLTFAWARPEEARVVQLDIRSLDEAGRGVVDELRRLYEAELESVVRRGLQEGAFHVVDVSIATRSVMYLLQGFAAQGEEAHGQPPALVIASCVGSVLRLVGGRVPVQSGNTGARSGVVRPMAASAAGNAR